MRTAGLTDVVVQRIEGPAWTAAEAAANGPLADVVFTEALVRREALLNRVGVRDLHLVAVAAAA